MHIVVEALRTSNVIGGHVLCIQSFFGLCCEHSIPLQQTCGKMLGNIPNGYQRLKIPISASDGAHAHSTPIWNNS